MKIELLACTCGRRTVNVCSSSNIGLNPLFLHVDVLNLLSTKSSAWPRTRTCKRSIQYLQLQSNLRFPEVFFRTVQKKACPLFYSKFRFTLTYGSITSPSVFPSGLGMWWPEMTLTVSLRGFLTLLEVMFAKVSRYAHYTTHFCPIFHHQFIRLSSSVVGGKWKECMANTRC